MIADCKNGLMVLDIAEGRVRPLLERRNTERLKGPNDLVFDARGNLYLTDQGQTGLHDPTGRVCRLAPDGRLEMLLGNVPSPNGIALSRDGKVLFVAAARTGATCTSPNPPRVPSCARASIRRDSACRGGPRTQGHSGIGWVTSAQIGRLLGRLSSVCPLCPLCSSRRPPAHRHGRHRDEGVVDIQHRGHRGRTEEIPE